MSMESIRAKLQDANRDEDGQGIYIGGGALLLVVLVVLLIMLL